MMKTSGSLRISSAIASRSASRMVCVIISVPAGTSGSGSATAAGADDTAGAEIIGLPSPTGERDSSTSLATLGAGAAAATLPRSAALSPSGRMVAIGVLTATSAVPSGIGIVPGEIRRRIDDLAHLGVDGLQFLLADLGRQEAVANLLDRILVVADLFDLFAGPVLRRIRHRVTAIAVGLHLQNERPLAGAA